MHSGFQPALRTSREPGRWARDSSHPRSSRKSNGSRERPWSAAGVVRERLAIPARCSARSRGAIRNRGAGRRSPRAPNGEAEVASDRQNDLSRVDGRRAESTDRGRRTTALDRMAHDRGRRHERRTHARSVPRDATAAPRGPLRARSHRDLIDQCIRMPCACTRKSVSLGAVRPPSGTNPQLTGPIAARALCIPLHRAR